MKQKYTAHILSHTHWDREWYLNSPYTNEWLIPFFNGLFAMFDKEPEYKFILDGQLSMIEDYFEELSKNGMSVSEAKRTIKGHVERGALSIGPYYLQPDWQLLSEESLVRNLTVGQKLAAGLGGSMKSGWLLDNFGQISQTAQIHKLAGLTGLFAWRGVAMDPESVTSEFLWESPDGTKMLSVYLLNSYRNVMRLAEYDRIMNKRMDAEVTKLVPFASTPHLLMMNGYDQEMIPDDIQPYIRNGALNGEVEDVVYTTVQDDPDSYLAAIAAEKPDLPVLKGALYNGRFISVFPGVMSSRMYLKLQNDDMQKLLEKKVEPLSLMEGLIAGSTGKTDGFGLNQMEQAWKLLLKNHPHDSICGVSIDDVHQDMEERSRQVFLLGNGLLEEKASKLAGAVDTSAVKGKEALVVFNTMTRSRNGVAEWRGGSVPVENVPALGYKVIDPENFSIKNPLRIDGKRVENKYLRFELNGDGSFNLEYKKTGKRYENLGLLEDMGDSGDEYNYSHPDRDKRITTAGQTARIETLRSSAWEVCYRISFGMELPVSDVNEHKDRSSETLIMPVVTYVSVEAGSPVVKCRTSVRNTIRDHRLRVLFPSGIDGETAWAASPFDITPRPIHIADYNEEEIPEHVRKVIVGAREARPSTYFQTREYLDLNDGIEGLAVFSKGLPEYQVIDPAAFEGAECTGDFSDLKAGTAALTLFRSVGWIAKEINTRIGDAGPEIYTPDAQCLREMSFEYAVCPHEGDAFSGAAGLADEYNSDFILASAPPSEGLLKSETGLLELTDSINGIKVTAVKPSEDGQTVILRGVNLGVKDTDAVLTTSAGRIESAAFVNFLEDPIESCCGAGPAAESDGRICFTLGPKEIFTLKFALVVDEVSVLSGKGFERSVRKDGEVLIETPDHREDFSAYPYTSYVTEGEIDSERKRAEVLEEKIEDPMWRRTALEAQLSVILSRHRKDEEEIRGLGYQLNEARVQRRIHDYLAANINLDEE